MTTIYNGAGSITLHLGTRILEVTEDELREINGDLIPLIESLEVEIENLEGAIEDLNAKVGVKEDEIIELMQQLQEHYSEEE